MLDEVQGNDDSQLTIKQQTVGCSQTMESIYCTDEVIVEFKYKSPNGEFITSEVRMKKANVCISTVNIIS